MKSLCPLSLLLAIFCPFAPATSAHAETLTPGETLTASFGATPNTSNLLFFLYNIPVTTTGTPVLTLDLYDGSSLLASIVAPPLAFRGNEYLQFEFEATAGITDVGIANAVADLSSVRNGSIQGMLDLTVAGGTISGLDLSSFYLYDARGNTGGYSPLNDLTNETLAIQTTPEVPTATLTATGLLGLSVFSSRRKRTGTRALTSRSR